MKTLSKLLLPVALSGFFVAASAYAVPPSKRTAPVPPGDATSQPAPAQKPAAESGVTCKYMSKLATGGAKGSKWVQCTPETLKNDPRCRAHCQ